MRAASALNSFLPAQAGTFAYFGMFRAIIVRSSFTTILAAGVVQNLFFGIIGTLDYVYLFATRGGSGDDEPSTRSRPTEAGRRRS